MTLLKKYSKLSPERFINHKLMLKTLKDLMYMKNCITIFLCNISKMLYEAGLKGTFHYESSYMNLTIAQVASVQCRFQLIVIAVSSQ